MRSRISEGNTGTRCTLFVNLGDLHYADDIALKQCSFNRIKHQHQETEVMALNCRVPHDIKVNGKQLKWSSSFTYLGSIVTSEGGADNLLSLEISGNLQTSVKNSKIYNSRVLCVLLYGGWRSETPASSQFSITHASERSYRYFAPHPPENHQQRVTPINRVWGYVNTYNKNDMGMDRPCIKKTSWRLGQSSIRMDTRREKKTGTSKNNI